MSLTPKEIFFALLQLSVAEDFSDIHLNPNRLPTIRNRSGEIEAVERLQIGQESITLTPVNDGDISKMIEEIITSKGYEKFVTVLELDASYQYVDGTKYRVNCYMDVSGPNIALRKIPSNIPTFEDLSLWDVIKTVCTSPKGLFLVTGPTGSGKSTTLASMIEYINQTQKKHIITIEDPIEFAFHSKKSLINQREIGHHTHGFHSAIRATMREDPDIIMVGEMRDPETIKAAITLAETGHLVFSTLHTNDTVQSIDRMIDVFPWQQQNQIRMQLAMSLVGILSQRLLPRLDGKGRIPAREILLNNDAIRNLIMTGNTHQIYSMIEIWGNSGMILMDKYLLFLYEKNYISREILFSFARDKDSMEMMVD